ncbi:MAG: hypothetical protein ACI83O_000871, partial [Patescibacteria group bacterium]
GNKVPASHSGHLGNKPSIFLPLHQFNHTLQIKPAPFKHT